MRRCRISGLPVRQLDGRAGPGAARRSTTSQITVPSPAESAARPLLRGGRAARHGPESPAPCALVRGYGAARLARPRGRSRPEGGVLEAVRPLSEDDLVRGQYLAGVVLGLEVPGSAKRTGSRRSRPSSRSSRWRLDRQRRWKDVPLLLRAGKRLPHRATEVAIVLRESERRLFEDAGIAGLRRISWRSASSPTRASPLVTKAKGPGPGWRSRRRADGLLLEELIRTRPAEANERTTDAVADDQTLFPAARRGRAGLGRSWLLPRRFQDHSSLRQDLRVPKAADELISPRA